MAVTRIKAYHGIGGNHGKHSPIQNSLDYITNPQKTNADLHEDMFDDPEELRLDSNAINVFNYSVNPEKTSYNADSANPEKRKGPEYDGNLFTGQELVSGYLCAPYMAAEQFEETMHLYHTRHEERYTAQTARRIFRAKLDENEQPVIDTNGEMIYDEKAPVFHNKEGKCIYQEYKKETKPRTAYMWVLSFPPEKVCGYKIDPRICHQIGLEFIRQIGGGQYQAVVATHMDRDHPHDHIVMCAYAQDGTHKYRDTKGSLMRARMICDDLSKKFGLPIIQALNQEQSRTISWKEWKAKQEGQSWKEQMRQDINGTARVARSFEHFIELMRASGYGIRETQNHITYTMPGDLGYRCRDSLLGMEYEKARIKEQIGHKMINAPEMSEVKELDIPYQPERNIHRPIRIYVARYTFSGRRRSDLEMIFLTAIRIIQELRNLFRNREAAKAQPTNPVHQDYTWKISQMLDSIKYAKDLGLESKEELNALLNETGTRLSMARSEVKELELDRAFAEKVYGLLENAEKYLADAEKIHFNINDLHINKLDKEQIRENLAKANPATPSQRRELYLQLQKNGEKYRLGCKYDQLNAKEAGEIISFLQNKNDIKPDILFEGSWKARESQKMSFEELRRKNDANDALFESHLLDYSPMEQQMILNLRSTVQQLADFGIDIEEYGAEKIAISKELDHLEDKLKDVEDLKQQYRSLKRLDYNLTLAETAAFTHGPSYEHEKEDFLEIHETRKPEMEEDKLDREPNNRNNVGNSYKPWAFSGIDSYFNSTHDLGF